MDINMKCISPDTDFSTLKMSKYDWDVVVKDKRMDIYRIEDYYHTIGGRHGNNNLWCCPENETPTHENMYKFDGEPCCWGISAEPVNDYGKRNYVNSRVRVTITRNGESFYIFGCRDLSYGLAKAQVIITRLEEHPINFSNKYYAENDILGRKIWYKSVPAVIIAWRQMDGCITVKAERGCKFPPDVPEETDDIPGYYDKDWQYIVRLDIIGHDHKSDIRWFRS